MPLCFTNRDQAWPRPIVNLHFVRELAPWSQGNCVVILAGGRQLLLGRRYRARFLELFG